MGEWLVPQLPVREDRLQAIHAALLPSGRVLIVNGSSNRNRFTPPASFQDGVDTTNLRSVDNTALFDPTTCDSKASMSFAGDEKFPHKPRDISGIARIASPATPSSDGATHDPRGGPNDLFCAGQVHLSDGRVLFAGGTARYYPSESFLGTRLTRVFNWRTESWEPGGPMRDGHWYPTTLPLADGRVVVLSGLSSEDYRLRGSFTNSSWVEVYDPSQPTERRWSAVDIRDLPGSPFDGDEWEMYPRAFPQADGRILLTGDGTGAGNLTGRRTYYLCLGPSKADGTAPDVRFEPGPDLPESGPRKTYATALYDPTSSRGAVLVLGGMQGTEDINLGPHNPAPDPGLMRVTSDLRRFLAPEKVGDLGRWDVLPNFLGSDATARRIMHVATILPTREVLVVGGGNFAFHEPVVRPVLMTPDASAPGGFRTRVMNPATQARLYHTTSLLLPDGRVLVAGGNASRAARSTVDGSIRLDTVRDRQGTYGFLEEGTTGLPAENWQMELFSPPYLFVGGPRPVIDKAPVTIGYGEEAELEVRDATETASIVLIRLGSVTHGWDVGQRLAELKFHGDHAAGRLRITAPTNRHLYPPGYYMLFYVNNRGYPSSAARVLLAEPGPAAR